MPYRRKQRVKNQGIDFVIGYLRKIAKDKAAPYSIRMKCLDRLAAIDDIYNIEITPTTEPSSEISPPEPPLEEVAVDDMLKELDKKLEGK